MTGRARVLNRKDAKGAKRERQGIEEVGAAVVDSALTVHQELGPGLLESAYQNCLAHELRSRDLHVECEVDLPISYRGLEIDAGYRVDMIVDDCVLIENKAVEKTLPIHAAQVLTYLQLSGIRLGFLLNWNVRLMKNGITRLVNNL
jgi:GxxExxY protein